MTNTKNAIQNHFARLEQQRATLQNLAKTDGANGFFGAEALRFISIAGTLLENFGPEKQFPDTDVSKIFIEILGRSLLENYFALLYIFDDFSLREDRHAEVINSFKRDYYNLLGEPELPHKDQLEPAPEDWAKACRGPKIQQMLRAVHNKHGDDLSYLYFIYRVTSFSIHGKNLPAVLQAAFEEKGSFDFPNLKLTEFSDLITNKYLCILQELRDAGEI